MITFRINIAFGNTIIQWFLSGNFAIVKRRYIASGRKNDAI